MKPWVPRIILLGLLALVVGLPLVLRAPGASNSPGNSGGSGGRLVILTPHTEQIRYEFSRAFNQWRTEQGKAPVEFDWRTGGTADLRKQVEAEFKAKARTGNEDRGIDKDLFFGGGDYDHGAMAAGPKVTRDDGTEGQVRILEPLRIAPEELTRVFPSPLIGSDRLYHKDLLWVGVALSSFGIVYNRDSLQALGLPEPGTWNDLMDRRYRGSVALADPAHSASIAVTYETILRRQGWAPGWATLRRCFANARYYTASSAKVSVDVSAGEAAAGMCIDFYGRYQAGAVGGRRVGYVDPPGMTAITADPISILRGAPHMDLAQEFVRWLLSESAQALWQRRCGTPGIPGGPAKYELRRLPVRRDLYNAQEMALWVDPVNAFEIAKPFPPGVPRLNRIVAPIAHAMAIDIQDDLRSAATAIEEHPDHPRAAEMARLFDAMPPGLDADWPRAILPSWEANPDQRLIDQARWTRFFQANYRSIVRIAREP